jgi:hypothetical protein
MTNEDLTIMLLDNVGWDYDKVLNPGHYKNTIDLLAGDLIFSIFSTSGTPDAAKFAGFSYKTYLTAIKRFLQPQFGELRGGGESWRFKFLTELELKYCSNCKLLRSFDRFNLDKSNSTGRHHYCKECRKVMNAITYKKEETKESHKRSYTKNYGIIRARNAEYKAERKLRTVGWADQEKIKEVYRNCPNNMHVDHIIPLKGEYVSGLHVHSNLQYLTAEDNMKKGNRFEIN